jgi:hypothetical protein
MLIPPSDELKRRIMHAYHGGLAGHPGPGRDETIRKVLQRFDWPGARHWVEQYVRGCATCQQNKNVTAGPEATRMAGLVQRAAGGDAPEEEGSWETTRASG